MLGDAFIRGVFSVKYGMPSSCWRQVTLTPIKTSSASSAYFVMQVFRHIFEPAIVAGIEAPTDLTTNYSLLADLVSYNFLKLPGNLLQRQ